MNQNRKADLQRKLSMTSVPKPPAGLSERLKADIPKNLMSVERNRTRFSRSATFSLGIAASIIVVISSAYIALQVLSHSDTKIASAPPSMVSRRAAPASPQAEVTITLAENKKDLDKGQVSEVSKVVRRDENEEAFADARKKIAKSNSVVALESPKEKTEPASAVAAGAVAVGGAAAPVPATAEAPAPMLTRQAEDQVADRAAARPEAATMNVGRIAGTVVPPNELFGLSVDPLAFDRVRREIEQGERPAARSVDTSALINYFSQRDTAGRRGVQLDVEASRAPLAPENTALVRFTIETPRGAPAVFATGADLAITLNSTAVITHRLLGADELKSQSALLTNVSVTGLMDVKLRPAISPGTTIATLTLRYRALSDDRTHSITRVVHASDVERNWDSASRRHRLATLGAVWSESLTGTASPDDLARTAEKLATEEPDDLRARELAAAASASSRLRSSGPTGSGR